MGSWFLTYRDHNRFVPFRPTDTMLIWFISVTLKTQLMGSVVKKEICLVNTNLKANVVCHFLTFRYINV